MYGNRNFGVRGGFSPVKVGDELDVKIEAVGKQGEGIAKEKGFVLFVPGAKEGDEVRIKVSKVLRNVGFADVIGQAQGKVEDSSSEEPATDDQAADAPAEEPSTEEEEKKE
jgi:predicted RNA-binding protein with TRAM domain